MTLAAPWFISFPHEGGAWCHWPRRTAMKKPTHTSVSLTKPTAIKLAVRARKEGVSVSALLERIVSAVMDAEEKVN